VKKLLEDEGAFGVYLLGETPQPREHFGSSVVDLCWGTPVGGPRINVGECNSASGSSDMERDEVVFDQTIAG
jgi:hypothetical protein